MIRELRKTDIKRVAEIWLNANLQAHSFISPQYWMGNFDLVKAMLQQARMRLPFRIHHRKASTSI